VRPVIEAIASAIARIYDDRSRHRCVVAGDDFRLDAVELAVVGQIFAEYLSTIYSRRSLRDVATDVVATIGQDAAGVVSMSVRDLNFVAEREAEEPVDRLTARMMSALLGGIAGDAQFDDASVFNARLTFKARVAPTAG
jgi:hypothetical protein